MNEKLRKRIVVDARVMAGKPVIKGTRVPVDAIMDRLAEGMTVSQVLEEYPRLKKEDVFAALEYSAEIVRGENVIPVVTKAK